MNESYVAERRQEAVKLRVAGSRLNDWIFSFFFLVMDGTIFVSCFFISTNFVGSSTKNSS